MPKDFDINDPAALERLRADVPHLRDTVAGFCCDADQVAIREAVYCIFGVALEVASVPAHPGLWALTFRPQQAPRPDERSVLEGFVQGLNYAKHDPTVPHDRASLERRSASLGAGPR